jgi:hypothetical protein
MRWFDDEEGVYVVGSFFLLPFLSCLFWYWFLLRGAFRVFSTDQFARWDCAYFTCIRAMELNAEKQTGSIDGDHRRDTHMRASPPSSLPRPRGVKRKILVRWQ